MKRLTCRSVIALIMLAAVALFAGCAKSEDNADSVFKAGTYQGSGQGIHEQILVEVTVDSENLKSIKILKNSETKGIADKALERIPERIIKSQSLAVDAVAGASVSSRGIIAAVEDALKKAGTIPESWYDKSASVSSEKEIIRKTADVVIIGGGGAGLAAAVSALESGASVIIIEKMPVLGGSTIMAGGQYNAVDGSRQSGYTMRTELVSELRKYTTDEPVNDIHKRLMSELSEQLDEYEKAGADYLFDSPQLYALQAFCGGDKKGNLRLLERFAYGAEESVEWLESIGVDFKDEIATVTGALWPRTHQFVKPLVTGPIEAYIQILDNNKDHAEVLFDTKALELVKKDGRITGVIAESDEAEYELSAARGVIIATGGFARNNEMVTSYNKHWDNLTNLNSTNSVSATGDGIVMAQKVGANLLGMEYIQLLPVGHPETGGMAGNISINAANQLFINSEGKRFVAEDERRDNLTKGLLAQPDQIMWILHDAHEYYSEDVKNDFNETIGQLVKSGVAVSGESIEELAQNMGVNPAALRKTVDDYNRAVAGETKDEMGKKLLQDPFDKPPFYASVRVPTIHHTMGGVQIDTETRVIGTDGKIIPGLYAAGEVTGDIHGANRLGGNAIPDTVVFGRIAGASAAASK